MGLTGVSSGYESNIVPWLRIPLFTYEPPFDLYNQGKIGPFPVVNRSFLICIQECYPKGKEGVRYGDRLPNRIL